MKIVVAGGRNKADFLIGSLLEKQHEVIVINEMCIRDRSSSTI